MRHKIKALLLAGIFLASSATFAAEQVFFFHTDPAGTPLAMTDASGSVVWKADYKPFGEENIVTSSQENNKKFIGKEKDEETGLYYFGARYMEPKIGRFAAIDPVGAVNPHTSGTNEGLLLNPQRLNKYAYSLNNPYKYLDPDGRWPTKVKLVHQASINRVLAFLPYSDRSILNAQQVEMGVDQSSAGAFRHAMRAPGQTPLEARQAANEFVRSELEIARNREKTGQHVEALRHLGNAIHTMQDSTSPAHQGFQEWDEHLSILSKVGHVKQEFFDPGAGSTLDAATQKAWNIFRSNAPIPVEILPRP